MKEIFNIKKPLLLFVTLITFTNIGYASFPVLGETIISIDTIIPDTNKSVKKETTEEYHLRMEKQGFDISNCRCEDCRTSKVSDIKKDRGLFTSSVLFKQVTVASVLLFFCLGVIVSWAIIKFLLKTDWSELGEL